MLKMKTLINEGKEIYFRIPPALYDAFYEECQNNGITHFLNGKEFKREDVHGLMGVTKKKAIGYVRGQCFAAVLAGHNDTEILCVDYEQMQEGEDAFIKKDPSILWNQEPLQGSVISIPDKIRHL